jgi:hypothetical protein
MTDLSQAREILALPFAGGLMVTTLVAGSWAFKNERKGSKEQLTAVIAFAITFVFWCFGLAIVFIGPLNFFLRIIMFLIGAGLLIGAVWLLVHGLFINPKKDGNDLAIAMMGREDFRREMRGYLEELGLILPLSDKKKGEGSLPGGERGVGGTFSGPPVSEMVTNEEEAPADQPSGA